MTTSVALHIINSGGLGMLEVARLCLQPLKPPLSDSDWYQLPTVLGPVERSSSASPVKLQRLQQESPLLSISMRKASKYFRIQSNIAPKSSFCLKLLVSRRQCSWFGVFNSIAYWEAASEQHVRRWEGETRWQTQRCWTRCPGKELQFVALQRSRIWVKIWARIFLVFH